MNARIPRRRIRSAVVVAVGLVAAGSSTGCARDRAYSSSPEGGISRIVRRPPLEQIGPNKPMFLGGYAGADYNRMTRPKPLRVREMPVEQLR